MAKFLMVETVHSDKVVTARVGTTGTPLKNVDSGKAVKLIATSTREHSLIRRGWRLR